MAFTNDHFTGVDGYSQKHNADEVGMDTSVHSINMPTVVVWCGYTKIFWEIMPCIYPYPSGLHHGQYNHLVLSNKKTQQNKNNVPNLGGVSKCQVMSRILG